MLLGFELSFKKRTICLIILMLPLQQNVVLKRPASMALRNVRHSARTQKLLGMYVLGGGGNVVGWVKLTRIFISIRKV